MSRLSFIVVLIIAGIAATGVFVLKHQVQKIEQQLAAVHRRAINQQEALHVLKAEWSHLNQPERLRDLAQRHLSLEPLAPGQIVGFAALPYRATEPTDGVLPDSPQPVPGGPTLASAGAKQ